MIQDRIRIAPGLAVQILSGSYVQKPSIAEKIHEKNHGKIIDFYISLIYAHYLSHRHYRNYVVNGPQKKMCCLFCHAQVGSKVVLIPILINLCHEYGMQALVQYSTVQFLHSLPCICHECVNQTLDLQRATCIIQYV